MDFLDELEQRSIYLLREAHFRFRPVGLLWSMGKDSTALVWLARKAFFGKIPFPVIHIDTSYKFKEMYEFRDRYAAEWDLDLRILRNEEALAAGMNHERGVLACCGALKTDGLRLAVERHGLHGLILGIRRDEHGVRAKERVFSPRAADLTWDYKDQPTELWDLFGSPAGVRTAHHTRVHPMLHWSELDIWRYMRREHIPVNPLYFSRNGKRYRSIGCAPCCAASDSQADTIDKIVRELETIRSGERSGRAQDKESSYTMQKLRSLGYM